MNLFNEELKTGLGALVVRIPAAINTKELLLVLLKHELKCPENYGTNWDAFEESITDLSWLKEKLILIIHEQFPCLPEKEFVIYIDILKQAVETWRVDKTKRLVVVFG